MEFLQREDFSLGWTPSGDLIKGPRNGFLRGDNLLLDELGVVSLRLGSLVFNPYNSNNPGSLLYLGDANSQVNSILTATINGVRNRYFGVTRGSDGLGIAYAGFGSFGSFDGEGDIILNSFQGQVLATRGTTHWKNDGTNTRSWGIAGPSSAPILTVLPPREILLSSFGVPDLPNWIPQGGEGTTASAVGRDGSVGGSIEVTPKGTTGRGVIQISAVGFFDTTNFDNGAATGAQEDSFEIYVWISNPDALQRMSLSFDVNPNSYSPFQDDYYYTEFGVLDATDVVLDNEQVLDDLPDISAPDRSRLGDEREVNRAPKSRPRDAVPNAPNAGWSKFTVLRGQFERVGSTPGCDWSTVTAIQLMFQYSTNATNGVVGTVKFDDLKILGGSDRTLTGKFKARYQWARVFDNYIALSPPSPISDEIECHNGAIVISGDATGVDFQVSESGGQMWGYLMGGTMTQPYRFAVSTEPPVGHPSLSCTISERDAIIANITLNTDLVTPPDEIIGLIGPHFNRIIALTERKVHIGMDGNPDSFLSSQELDLADPSESILWGIKSDTVVLIGTTKDVYRLSGSLAQFPDLTTDARLEPLGVEGPPTSEFVVQDGGLVVYLSADGFRILQGAGSVLINWNIDLLIEGYTRHGVSLSIHPSSGRMSGGIYDGKMYVNLAGSNYVYVADFRRKNWRREFYPLSAFRRIYREPDGGIIAGDSNGRVWSLNRADVQGDCDFPDEVFGSLIPYTYWTTSDDNGKPYQYKEGFDWRAEMLTGGQVIAVTLVLDETTNIVFGAFNTSYGSVQDSLGSAPGIVPFKRVQMKIEGSGREFKLGMWGVSYRPRPIPLLYWDSSLLDFGTQDLVWLRELKLKGRSPVNLRVRVKFDGLTRVDKVVTVGSFNTDSVWPVDIGPEVKGKLPLVIVEPDGVLTTPDNGFELYWMSVKYKGSGGITQKQFKIAPQ